MKNVDREARPRMNSSELRRSIAATSQMVKEKGAGGGEIIGDDEFHAVSKMIGELTGIVIKDHKREMIQSRLSRRVRALNLGGFKAYVDFVRSDAGSSEIGELINAVTTNLTAFFREGHHFEHLRDKVLDPMARSGAGRARIWSAACSSGEEPYSIAMTILNSAAAKMSDVRLLATDLDTNILARAKRGVYPRERTEAIPQALAASSLDKRPDGDLEFKPAVKKLITFNQLNLLHDWPMKGPFDAIFCRNVLIYFDNEPKKRIVDKMASLLRVDGALYLGHSESLLGDHPKLLSEGRTIYRRVK